MADLDTEYLKKVVEEKLTATIFLISGVKLTGRITNYDENCIVIIHKGKDKGAMETQIVYKTAISTIFA